MQRPSSTPGRQDVVVRTHYPPPAVPAGSPPPPPLRSRDVVSLARQTPQPTHVGLRRIFAMTGIGVIAILGAIIVADPRTEAIEVFQILVVLPALLLLSSIPFLIYFAEIRSLAVSVVLGVVLLGCTTAMYMAVLTSDSPGTSFVLLASPLVNLLLVGIALTVDFLFFAPVD